MQAAAKGGNEDDGSDEEIVHSDDIHFEPIVSLPEVRLRIRNRLYQHRELHGSVHKQYCSCILWRMICVLTSHAVRRGVGIKYQGRRQGFILIEQAKGSIVCWVTVVV